MIRMIGRGAILALLVCGWGVPVAAQTLVRTTTLSTANASCTASPTSCAIAEDVRGVPSLGVYLNVGTSGTFHFEALIEESPSEIWFAVADDIGGASTATADGAFFFSNPGYRKFRVRASAISGNATVRIEQGFTGLRSTATLSGASQGDGAIQDGASSAIEATVRDYTNSNPLSVVLTDTNGDPITAVGGGQQYAVDTALGATPTGTLAVAIRDDALSALTPVEGDAIGLRVDSVGALWTAVNGNVSITQGGTLTVQPGNTANTTPWLMTIQQGGLPATVRDTGTADSLNVAIVDASGNQITTFGGGTEVAEDGVAANGVLGSVLIVRRADAASSSATTDGDYAMLNTDASGRLWVNCGTGCAGGTQFAEDLPHTTADVGTVALAVRRDTAASGTNLDGDYASINVDSTGRLWSNTEFMDAFAGADNVANPTTSAVHALNYVWDGSAWDRAQPSLVTEATHDAALTVGSTVGTLPVLVAKDFDGTALPNAVGLEGDAQFFSGSLAGVQYVMVVNEDGSATGQIRLWDGTDTALIDGSGNLAVSCANCSGSGVSVNEDTASADAHPGTPAYTVRQDSPSTTTSTDGDYQPLKSTANGRLYTSTTVDAALPAGDNDIGNVDLEFAGTAAATNNGTASAQTLRVAVASDNSAVSGFGVGATGSAVPANAMYLAGRAGANLRPFTNCDTNAHLRMTTATTTELVAAPGSGRVRFCLLQVFAEGTTNVTIVRGTGSNCATGQATIAGPFGLTAQTGWNLPVGIGEVMDAGADTSAVCITSSAAVGVTIFGRQTSY